MQKIAFSIDWAVLAVSVSSFDDWLLQDIVIIEIINIQNRLSVSFMLEVLIWLLKSESQRGRGSREIRWQGCISC